ncbi:peptide chain release factor N(5)-glutamine methyltransferase [Candidatus Latescibacterota bacterium]
MRVIDLITTASEHLKEKDFENSRLEVEHLLGSVLGLSRINLYMEFDRPVTEQELDQFRTLYRRRLAREPLQYILGSTEFRELEIKTDRRALIPRQETELLVQTAVDFLKERRNPLVADLGTGTGVIALSIAYEIPGAHVVAVDISNDALMLTEQNARKLGLEKSVTLVTGDMLNGIRNYGPFDSILSNPPYVKSHHIETLQSEISDYEPKGALDGGSDGLRYLNSIAEDAHCHLKSGGMLLLECEGDQAQSVKKTIDAKGAYSKVDILKDLASKDRIVRAYCKEK